MEKSAQDLREDIVHLFEQIGRHYKARGLAEPDIRCHHDVHGFYNFNRNAAQTLHLQGYPGMSNDQEACVAARVMDHQILMRIRGQRAVSDGNEHESVLRRLPNFQNQVMIPYNPAVLEALLEKDVPELL